MKMLETFLWRNPSIFGVHHTHCFQSICPSFAHLAFIELKASRLNKWGLKKLLEIVKLKAVKNHHIFTKYFQLIFFVNLCSEKSTGVRQDHFY